MMTAEQRGVYVQLLAEQWYSGTGLPESDDALIRLANCTAAEWERSKASVLAHFPAEENGRRWNEKLRTLQAETTELSQCRSLAGKRGNVVRWKSGSNKKGIKTGIPEKFALSDSVRRWAAEHGVTQLQGHFDHFVGVAKARGYQYSNWDQALMNAIRDNWAKLDRLPVRTTGASLVDRTAAALEAE